MGSFKNLIIVREFKSMGKFCGVYSIKFRGDDEVFIRNGKFLGVVAFLYGAQASKCVLPVRDDVQKEFLEYLEQSR